MAPYKVRSIARWDDVPAEWASLASDGRATPFQSAPFLAAWYETLGAEPGVTPLIVEARAADDTPALLMPLVLRRRFGFRVLGFTDEGVADNSAPVLGPGAPRDPEGFALLWRAVRSALPGADLFMADRQPQHLSGLPNPMLSLGEPLPSLMTAHPLVLGDSWEDYSRSRSTKFRKEQERVWRVFTRHEGAGFSLVTDTARALDVLTDIERLQKARMEEIGAEYRLNEPAHRAFYRALFARGLPAGAVKLGVLSANGQMVGALLGLHDGRTTTFVRLAHAGGEWATSSPGRLVIERTLMALHAEGVRHFDFSIGDHHYKENFRVGSAPLSRLSLPLSWRGRPATTAVRFRSWLRKSPRLRALVHRLRGQTPQSLARST